MEYYSPRFMQEVIN